MTDIKHTKREYNKFAEEYHTRLVNNNTNQYHKYVEKPYFIDLLKNSIKGKKVLDLGCGSGIFTQRLLKFKPKKLVGLDLSDGLIKIAKKEYPSIKFFSGDAKKTKFKHKNFNVVMSSLMVHYFDNLDPLFREVSRILKKDGKFIFSMHHPIMEATSRLKVNGKKDSKKRLLKNYFKEEKYKWKLGEKMKNMIAYHHTFETIFKNLNKNGFVVENLFETRPGKMFKKINKKHYDHTTNNPSFLIIEARKIK